MNKKSVKLVLVMAALALFLAACGRYVSSYRAVGLVRTNSAGAASMSFMTFEGRMVFRLKCAQDQRLNYEAKLTSGRAAVYCDADGTKTELFSLGAGEELASSFGPLQKGTVYIIVETDGRCEEGGFRFGTAQAEGN